MDIGRAFKIVRKLKNLSQGELATKVGITQTYLSMIENNHKDANLSLLKKISEKLDFPLPMIFFLALDNKDVNPEKVESFNLLFPSMRALVLKFFITED